MMNQSEIPVVSRQQRLILMASLIDAGVAFELVEAMGKFYPIFLRRAYAGVNDIVEDLDDPKWTRDVVLNRITRLTQEGYLEKEHYRAWRLNVDKILSLNKR